MHRFAQLSMPCVLLNTSYFKIPLFCCTLLGLMLQALQHTGFAFDSLALYLFRILRLGFRSSLKKLPVKLWKALQELVVSIGFEAAIPCLEQNCYLSLPCDNNLRWYIILFP